MKTLEITVEGKVQGVWYRTYTKQFADVFKLKGYVKNKEKNKVEILATGLEDDLQALIKWCYAGSPLSQVEKVTWIEKNEIINTNKFQIKMR